MEGNTQTVLKDSCFSFSTTLDYYTPGRMQMYLFRTSRFSNAKNISPIGLRIGSKRSNHSGNELVVTTKCMRPYLIWVILVNYTLINHSLVCEIVSKTTSFRDLEGVHTCVSLQPYVMLKYTDRSFITIRST